MPHPSLGRRRRLWTTTRRRGPKRGKNRLLCNRCLVGLAKKNLEARIAECRRILGQSIMDPNAPAMQGSPDDPIPPAVALSPFLLPVALRPRANAAAAVQKAAKFHKNQRTEAPRASESVHLDLTEHRSKVTMSAFPWACRTHRVVHNGVAWISCHAWRCDQSNRVESKMAGIDSASAQGKQARLASQPQPQSCSTKPEDARFSTFATPE
ncbi:hypothetical protein B0H14DRAFT_2591330 [Mycena olivaceomarginata]|nr:hypothetical protein B0H14DRAFT_2591330 [Mycena olivaceomarginata]